jgi:putative two-component system response regulator
MEKKSVTIVAAPAFFVARRAREHRMDKRSFRILAVDDDPRNLRLIESILRPEGYEIELAGSGEAALAAAQERPPDLILLDVMMPGMNGFDVAARLKERAQTRAVPIIMVTSLTDRASRLAALDMGAEDFLSKPIDRAELWARVRNLLRLKEYSDQLADQARLLEERVRERSSQLTESYRQTIKTLNRAASYRDEETGAHVKRISFYCVELGELMGMDSEFCSTIYYASPMHDLGKIAIPDRVLLKPGSLDPGEWEIMKTHAAVGAKMLEDGDSPYLNMGREIAMSHHERWDGTGYPQGLRGDQIPFAARLMGIADVYDALRSRRCYKPPFEHERAVEIITQGDGRTRPEHFDPAVLDAFRKCHLTLRGIYEENADDDDAVAA